MKFSENWLREWVNPAISSDELVTQITMAGLEVDDVEKVANDFSGVVVAEIVSAEQHPNADKLRVCQVCDGSETFQVVCGAPNARAGIKVAFAKVGAVLGADFKIKKAKLRQEESFGMLCSASELGLSDDHDGIIELPADALLGQDIRVYLSLDDQIIDVDLTPNRSDCLSVLGLAREVGVLNKQDVQSISIPENTVQIDDVFTVNVEATSACPRYVGRVVKGINPEAETPLWMVEKLRRSGIRSIDPIVDITNYVMLELGQPMHAFDLDTLDNRICVRHAVNGEKIVLLDGQEIALRSDTLLIADDNKPLAIAGIMGGEGSGVSTQTKDIFLESAFFAPLALAGKARSYGLHTDSSHRFERGVDSALQTTAIERATALILEISGGQVGPLVCVESQEDLPKASEVTLRRQKLNQYLALDIGQETVTDIFERLGLEMVSVTDDAWTVKAPSHRFDIAIEADLIEEIARVYGYENIPASMPAAAIDFSPLKEADTPMDMARSVLVAYGYQEAITYSFIDPVWAKKFYPSIDAIPLENPISTDMGVMRPGIIPGLVKSYLHNQNRQQSRIRLFESGRRFIGTVDALDQMDQEIQLAGLIAGSREPESWYSSKDSVDFFDLKAHVEALFEIHNNTALTFKKADVSYLHPGRSAVILQDGVDVGVIGELHPQLANDLGCHQAIYVFEVSLASVLGGQLPRYQPISKFPEVRRDLALVVDRALPVVDIESVIHLAAGESFQKVTVFDVYQGQGIDESKKSVALGLTWQHPSHTLSDEEINNAMSAVIAQLDQKLGAVIRG